MIILRKPDEIHQARGQIDNGTFQGRWHFSFDMYYDPDSMHFGALRVFNDDTLSPGAVWPLHPHHEIEVVTYCAEGEFRHADERGKGGVLKKGWVQHATIGKGMFHAEINNCADDAMRFIQMWFMPSEPQLEPDIQQKPVEREERANRLLPLVAPHRRKALPIHANAEVYSSFLQANHRLRFSPRAGWGAYLYVVEGGPVNLNGQNLDTLAAAKVLEEKKLDLHAKADAELLLVHVGLA
jgi:quercetin 2,3-dioxygenase